MDPQGIYMRELSLVIIRAIKVYVETCPEIEHEMVIKSLAECLITCCLSIGVEKEDFLNGISMHWDYEKKEAERIKNEQNS